MAFKPGIGRITLLLKINKIHPYLKIENCVDRVAQNFIFKQLNPALKKKLNLKL